MIPYLRGKDRGVRVLYCCYLQNSWLVCSRTATLGNTRWRWSTESAATAWTHTPEWWSGWYHCASGYQLSSHSTESPPGTPGWQSVPVQDKGQQLDTHWWTSGIQYDWIHWTHHNYWFGINWKPKYIYCCHLNRNSKQKYFTFYNVWI